MQEICQLRIQQFRGSVYNEGNEVKSLEEAIMERRLSAFLPSLRFRLYSQ